MSDIQQNLDRFIGEFTIINSTESKGGAGSGNFGHAGRPGEVGGSSSGGAPKVSGADAYEGLPEEFRVSDIEVALDGYVGGGLLEEGGFDIARLALKYAWEHDAAGRNAQLNRVADFFSNDPVTLYHVSSSKLSTFTKRGENAFQPFSSFTYDKDAVPALMNLLGNKGFVYEVSVPKSSIGVVVDYKDQPNRDFWAEQKEVITYKPVSAKNIVNSKEFKGGAGSGNFQHVGRPGLVGGSGLDSAGTIAEDAGGTVELGKPFIVYRLGSAEGSLAGRNAGNANAIGDHLVRLSDVEAPSFATGFGDTISVYSVTLNSQPGQYQRSVAGVGINATNVGRAVSGTGQDTQIVYSFPAAGGDHKVELLARIPLADLQKRLETFGFDTADDAGIRNTAKAIRQLTAEKLKTFKLRSGEESKGGEGSGNFGHAGRPGLVGGSAQEASKIFDVTTTTYDGKHQFIFKKSGVEVGEIAVVPRADSNYEVSNVLVWPKFQRQGAATEFYRHAFEFAKSKGKKLFISGDRTADAIALHEHFQKLGILKSDGEIVF